MASELTRDSLSENTKSSILLRMSHTFFTKYSRAVEKKTQILMSINLHVVCENNLFEAKTR
jgi:hypothetical protein